MADKEYSPDNPFAPKEGKYSKDNPFAQGLGDQEMKSMSLPGLAGESFLDALLATPDALADLFVKSAAGFGGPAGAAMNPDVPLPRPTVGEIGATVRAPFIAGEDETLTQAYGRDLAEQDIMRMNTERESPTGSIVAPLVGDAFALLTGRMPFANRISKFEDALMTVNKPDLFFSTAQVSKAPITVRKAIWDGITQSKAVRSILRGTGRATEAGLEATVLDIVNGEDPGETFGYAAGLQGLNSVALNGLQHLTKGGAGPATVKLAIAGYVGAQLWNMFQIATPIDDNFLNALNASNEKVLFGLAIGTLAGVAGGGRFRGSTDEMSKTAQTFADAVTAVPRGTVTGLIRSMNEATPEQQQASQMLMQQMFLNPEAFTKGEQARINSALEKGTFPDTAMILMRDKRFVDRIMQQPEPPTFSGFENEPDLSGFANFPQGIR